jgi:oxaloacetate decarboxylase gamma subunit
MMARIDVGVEMLAEGGLLMVVGMTTVFSFLALLVLVMHGSAAFFRAFADRFPEPEAAAVVRRAPNDDTAVVAAIVAAIAAHRAQRS